MSDAIAPVLLIVVLWFAIASAFAGVLIAPLLLMVKLAVRQAERYDAALLAGEPCRLRPPLRWLVSLLHGREAVEYADMLASAPQGVRDLRTQYLREQHERIDRLLARMREFRERHGRWPDLRELACRDRDTRNETEQG